MKKEIKVILTGGTIDSIYDGTKDTAVPLKHSALPAFIKNLRSDDIFSFTEVCMKDSRAITTADLKKVLKIADTTKEKIVIITHGTYTMPDTSRFLAANMKKKDKVVVLTGSMIPLTGFAPSDAPFNLGYSIASAKALKPGVYVCMNGSIFMHSEVAKRVSEGRFISIFNNN